ncbi:helix-turn-helix domain-containing protein [Flavobacterium sp.]|uniref:helix-turn-helix domain-containing protein n=1 Tax=Flavobacterium sp. TaxID=239 RepID=UPI003750219D
MLILFVFVQKQLDEIKETLTKRIYILFMEKYNGNKSRFAKDVGCDEKTLRLIFNNKQGMTMNLFFKIANALKIKPEDLIKGLQIFKEEEG